jgi:hypothetical protein
MHLWNVCWFARTVFQSRFAVDEFSVPHLRSRANLFAQDAESDESFPAFSLLNGLQNLSRWQEHVVQLSFLQRSMPCYNIDVIGFFTRRYVCMLAPHALTAVAQHVK